MQIPTIYIIVYYYNSSQCLLAVAIFCTIKQICIINLLITYTDRVLNKFALMNSEPNDQIGSFHQFFVIRNVELELVFPTVEVTNV